MHEAVVLSKLIVPAYYEPKQQLIASHYRHFPNDFDGALIGEPAWWNTHQEP